MLDEYILEHLNKIEAEREQLTEKLQTYVREEETANQKIQELLEQENVGIELFSPRSAHNSIKAQIALLQKHIDEIQYEEARLEDLLEQNKLNDEKYQLLLLESRENAETATEEVQASVSENDKAEIKEELETILIRVEKCLNLIHSDKIKCKNELKNLRYYIKALLSKN